MYAITDSVVAKFAILSVRYCNQRGFRQLSICQDDASRFQNDHGATAIRTYDVRSTANRYTRLIEVAVYVLQPNTSMLIVAGLKSGMMSCGSVMKKSDAVILSSGNRSSGQVGAVDGGDSVYLVFDGARYVLTVRCPLNSEIL